ncbi:MAG TPA: hypothetical protein VNM47_11525, partial [Terriglobia bacterium]|nr:hypothetical protein [Terriglobia bacterium]
MFMKMEFSHLGERIILLVVALSALVGGPARAAARQLTSEADQIKTAQQGLGLLMNGDVEGATKAFQKIESDDPDSALGYLMEADAVWWRIYFTTGNLIDPDVFVVPSGSSTP